jgi:hypothetical protein
MERDIPRGTVLQFVKAFSTLKNDTFPADRDALLLQRSVHAGAPYFFPPFRWRLLTAPAHALQKCFEALIEWSACELHVVAGAANGARSAA